MARAALQRRLTWLRATVLDNRPETARVQRIVLDVPEWRGHLPGQHVDLRLTAEDGYAAQRSYSIASASEDPRIHLLVERVAGGEVSGYLADEVRAGDLLELRGPIGGYFVWPSAADRGGGRPVQLVAGGAGVSPFLAMLDHHRRSGSSTPVRLLYSVRTIDDVLGRELLGALTTITVTRETPPGWSGPTGRVDRDMLRMQAFPPTAGAQILVCGPTAFVEMVATDLVDIGHDPSSIRLERFGGSGGSSGAT